METIGNYAMKDVVRLCPDYMLDDAEITVQECHICIARGDWKFTFCGDGVVILQKDENEAQTYDDHSYLGESNVLEKMMAHYERKIRFHTVVEKYKVRRNEIWEAACLLCDNGVIDDVALQHIRSEYGLRWALNQAKAELGL